MQIKPILATLRKHKLATILIALEIALACAVLCNASFMVANRFAQMDVPSGVDESALGVISVMGFQPKQAVDLNARMLAGLRAIPGVQSVSVISSVPFLVDGLRMGVAPKSTAKHPTGVPNFYKAGPGAFKALGLTLVAGRAPKAGDYQSGVPQLPVPNGSRVLITRAMANELWPGGKAVGKEFWTGHLLHFRVIGVVRYLARPSPSGSNPRRRVQGSVFVPLQPGPKLAGTYLIRAKPRNLNRVMVQARLAVRKIAPNVVLDQDASHTIPSLRHAFFQRDRSMSGLLVGIIIALLGVTALGIVGLASFWVGQRRKSIGIRRALGATRGDILRYFQTENFLIVTCGVLAGVLLAYVISVTLMQFYAMPRLPFWYLPISAVVLWLLGQLAVLAPALRASNVPPVVATRSV